MVCANCKRKHSGHVFAAGKWLCSDCAYELEHGSVERRPPMRAYRQGQLERLFPLPPAEPMRRAE